MDQDPPDVQTQRVALERDALNVRTAHDQLALIDGVFGIALLPTPAASAPVKCHSF